MYTSKNIYQDVALIIDGLGETGNFDTQGIVDELHETYGLTKVVDIPSHRFWAVFEKHVKSVVPA